MLPGNTIIPLLRQLGRNGCSKCKNISDTSDNFTGSLNLSIHNSNGRCFINSIHSRTLGVFMNYEQKRNFYTSWNMWSRKSDSRSQRAKPLEDEDWVLPQVEVPADDGDMFSVPSTEFKGMVTDFPCLTRK